MTTRHLLLVSIGPIQDFISAARRTRDLWFGSHLLSEIARGAARVAAEGGAQLIFPALDKGDPELEMCLQPLRGDEPPHNIANKLLAVVPEGVKTDALAERVRAGALEAWRTLAEGAYSEVRGLLRDDARAIWDEQIDSLLEFNAVWAPFGADSEYAAARERLEAALASRKNLREFKPWVMDRGGLPKSSLDGARISVLHKDAHKRSTARKLRLTPGEELDAVGLVKRAGGEPHQFIPLVNVSYAPWLTRAEERCPGELEALKDAAALLHEALDDMKPLRRSELGWIKRFPYDAHLINPERLSAIEAEWLGAEPSEQEAACWAKVGETASALRRKMQGGPTPYVACLLADGDKMGAALEGLKEIKAHRTFSTHLASFAARAHEVVEQQHRGMLVYAGGDDVLAFVALEDAVPCAIALKELFLEVMREALPASIKDAELPTLSVGLGVGHMLESMGHLRELAKEAERAAKGSHLPYGQSRNALAIVLDKRSGNKITWRARWDAGGGALILKALEALAEETSLSSKKVYQVRATLDQMPKPAKVTLSAKEQEDWRELLVAEVARVLGRSHIEHGDALKADAVGLDLEAVRSFGEAHHAVDQWVTRMLIARTIAEARGWSLDEDDSKRYGVKA